MSTYTCPHCGQHDLSTQMRHNCPKLPSLSIPLGPPRSMDPCANEYIARLTRELEAARKRERTLREAILAELHGAGGIPVAEIGPDGVQRLWEVLVQTEVRNA